MTEVVVIEDSATKLRWFLANVLRHATPDGATFDDMLDQLRRHMHWVEKAWFECHSAHVFHEQLLEIKGPVDDAEARIRGAVSAEAFSTPDDYEKAVDLAVRAYCEGIIRAS